MKLDSRVAGSQFVRALDFLQRLVKQPNVKINCSQKTVSVREIRSYGQGVTSLRDRFFVRKAVGWTPKQTSSRHVSRRKIGIELKGFPYCTLGFEIPLLVGSIEKI